MSEAKKLEAYIPGEAGEREAALERLREVCLESGYVLNFYNGVMPSGVYSIRSNEQKHLIVSTKITVGQAFLLIGKMSLAIA